MKVVDANELLYQAAACDGVTYRVSGTEAAVTPATLPVLYTKRDKLNEIDINCS